ncbi:MAG: aldehyde dehydrogenase family protein, partial [Cyclobacteriaceae bacterium]
MSVELKFPEVKNYISGHFVDSPCKKIDVVSPLDGTLLSKVPISGADTLDQAVSAAVKAFPAWSATPIKERVQILFNYRNLLQKYRAELTELISLENGKIKSEA